MKFVSFVGKYWDEAKGTWESATTTKVVRSDFVELTTEGEDRFVTVLRNNKTNNYFLVTKEELDRLSDILIKQSEPEEEILKRIVQNAIKELEV